MATAKLKIEHWPIEKVVPYANNARIHSPEQQALLKASIDKFGFINPVLVDANGTLIAGHNRAAVAVQVGMKTLPVIQLAHLSEGDAKALRLADNSIPERAHWSPELVETELAALAELNFDVDSLGLDEIKLPELEELDPTVSRSPRKKTTIFVSVANADAEKSRKIIASALSRAKIEHNQ